MMKRQTKVLVAGLVLLILLAGTMLKNSPTDTNVFPRTLGDMDLKMYIDGEEASQSVAQLHSSGESVNPGETYIARYRNYDANPANMADVWLSVSESGSSATVLVNSMTARMTNGMMFTSPQIREIGGQIVYYTEGTGQYHYYYARDNKVIWIGLSNPDAAYQTKIILIALDEI